MMKKLWIATVLMVAMTLDQTKLVSALDRLCVNAETSIKKLYIDGKDYTSLLKNRNNVRRCDCVVIPVNSGVIAIEATSRKHVTPGILACNTAHPHLEEVWKCRPTYKARSSNWYKPNYDDRAWKKSRGTQCKHCQRYYKTPCHSESKCFWSHKPSTGVRCRVKQCADACKSCKKTGYGKCDPGQCIWGTGENVLTGQQTCKRRCRLDVKATNRDKPLNGYIKVTDMISKFAQLWNLTVAGDYVAAVDMTSCTLTGLHYATFYEASDRLIRGLFQQWNNVVTGKNFTNVIGVEVGVGDSNYTSLGAKYMSFAPWIAVAKLGLGDVNPAYSNEHYGSFSAILTGVQNGNVTVTEIKRVCGDPAYYTGCA